MVPDLDLLMGNRLSRLHSARSVVLVSDPRPRSWGTPVVPEVVTQTDKIHCELGIYLLTGIRGSERFLSTKLGQLVPRIVLYPPPTLGRTRSRPLPGSCSLIELRGWHRENSANHNPTLALVNGVQAAYDCRYPGRAGQTLPNP